MEENKDLLPEETGDHDRIIPVNIETEMKTAYIDYSMSVIVGRALPDVRDGFKPVHRRVLYAMNELSNHSNKPYKKSARIVGEVMGKYHPHGDSSIYFTVVRMAQDFTMRYTLVDGQGNFGTQDGDSPAAMRYTEIRLSKLAETMLEDIEKDTVDFHLNFDDSLQEPGVLPTRIPQLLLNGSSGIAVGMATNMMPHNLTEVIDGCLAYVADREIVIEDLMKIVKAPDFPTGGIIFGMDGVRQAMMTGRGRVMVRGKCHVETKESGREKIVITEVPYQVSLDGLTDKIGQLATNKVIDGIAYVNNETSKRGGIRIVVELKRDAVANVVINQLYKYSELQTSFGINNVAISKGRPRTLNLRQLISEFIEFRMDVVIRRSKFELKKAQEKEHLLRGYLIALDNLDEVIRIIRESPNPAVAKENLVSAQLKLKNSQIIQLLGEVTANEFLDEIQAQAILEMRLQRLTGMERDKIQADYNELMEFIGKLKHLLANEDARYEVIKEELIEVKTKFGDERKSLIEYNANDISIEDLIEQEDVVITISHLGYIKRTSATEYRQQRRGGRGGKGAATRNEDYVEHLFVASTHDTMMFFTEKGRVFWLKVYEIPEGEKNTKGRAIQNLIQIPGDDKVRAIINVKKLTDEEYVNNHFVVLCTKKGIIKKTALKDFSRPRATGVNAITINDGDELIEAMLTDGNSEVMLAIKSGRAIRFPESKVRPTGRGAIGVAGIEVDASDDEVIGMIHVDKEDTDHTVLVVSEKGYGKRTRIVDEMGEDVYRVTNRGGKGVKTINVTEKTGKLVGILNVTEKHDLIITCKSGITLRTDVAAIKEAGRNTQGVILIRLDEGDEIAAISKIDEQQMEDEQAVAEDVEGTEITTITADNTEDAPQEANTDSVEGDSADNNPQDNNNTDGDDQSTPEIEGEGEEQ
ncbi:DNA gyrase subunit A [Arachidicoccus ginsenosidivorans]|jgi:DNA gyrase subunit A|uniref:DNA gyrase subunit A n=1 Tax=Arachidicoccus ginsenosidivorans TaxID=496057 RepID=A0A5B8VPW2_9BACT|nr:DNA gyrase subunit A [Arachidicoccus ginsenosidivorans]QEC72932.1 DNA gyrase subunit A [Arachidicoccus ginsenosidivorans]